MGRPVKPIDQRQLERLLQMYPTKAQVATFFDCSEGHVENEIDRLYECTFSALRERQIEGTKRAIFGWALKYAKRGNENLIKFLMKNIHKYNDKLEIEPAGNQSFELKYNIVKKEHPQLEERVVSEEKKDNE